MKSGVPQRLVLGPLPFLTFIKNLDSVSLVTTYIYQTINENKQRCSDITERSDKYSCVVGQMEDELNTDKCSVLFIDRNNHQRNRILNSKVFHHSIQKRDLSVSLCFDLRLRSHCFGLFSEALPNEAQKLFLSYICLQSGLT